jgi:hypothetical protein
VHVLVAAEDQERKETEDLLASFDRPGRGPKRPSGGERDFVDYYSKKKGEGPASDRERPAAPPAGALPVTLKPRPSDESTLVRRRPKLPREGLPPWLGWAGIVFAMLCVGGVAAYFANGDVGPKAGAALPPSAPTLTAATPATTTTQPQAARPSEDIPPPSAAEPSATASTGATAASGAATTAPPPAPVAADPAPASSDPAPRASARKDARPPASAGAAPSGAAGAPRGAADPRANGDRKPPPRDDFIRDL